MKWPCPRLFLHSQVHYALVFSDPAKACSILEKIDRAFAIDREYDAPAVYREAAFMFDEYSLEWSVLRMMGMALWVQSEQRS